MQEKVKIFWATPERDMYGNALGYATHNAQMLKHTLPLIDNDPQAKIVLQVVSADQFVPLEGKINVLFTMWEFLDVPETYKKALAEADYVIVPSRFCRDIFAQYCKRKPIVCFEGVSPEVYQYSKRTLNGKFRLLWVGAPNPRKGYQSILQLLKLADMYPQLEFYLKTTVKSVNPIEFVKATIKHWKNIVDVKHEGAGVATWMRILRRLPSPWNANRVFKYGKNKNIVVDTRRVPTTELVNLYHQSHVFLFPTLGEGWGLTLCEAMATGLPCIAVAETGCKDFFDENVGFTIKHDVKDLGEMPNYKMKSCRAYVPDTNDFFLKVMAVINNYGEALRRGQKASERVRSKFTWRQSGIRLAEILTEIAEAEVEDEKTRQATYQCNQAGVSC